MKTTQTIINGDCLEIMKTFKDKQFDLVLTDPPYGMSFRSNYRRIRYGMIENDNSMDWLPNFMGGSGGF